MNKKRIIAIFMLLIVAVVGIALAVNSRLDTGEKKVNLDLYFFNEQKTSIVAEKHELKYQTAGELPEVMIKALINGPTDKKNSGIMSKKTKLLSIDTENENITVDFSREYLSGDGTQDIMATYAVVKSLCGVKGVKHVKVTVEKKDIIAPDGSPIDFLSSKDINLSSEEDLTASRRVTLYFASKETQMLVREVRKINITEKQPVEQYIINELINGPVNKELQPVLSSDTSLLSVDTKDNICYVNFKASSVDKNSGSREKELLAIYAIVNSLTELDNVKEVQFLIDGKKADTFGGTPISDLFSRNEQMISK